jgi:hypothetical protein
MVVLWGLAQPAAAPLFCRHHMQLLLLLLLLLLPACRHSTPKGFITAPGVTRLVVELLGGWLLMVLRGGTPLRPSRVAIRACSAGAPTAAAAAARAHVRDVVQLLWRPPGHARRPLLLLLLLP